MSKDKRTVHTDALDTLGHIIGEAEERDAIHLAVEPIIAAHTLRPGEDVGVLPCGKAGTDCKHVGIVDPFLKSPVKKGERFWLVVYPRQITSLRHVWAHPDFVPVAAAKVEEKSNRQVSVDWMTAWAVKHMGEDYYGDYNTPLSPETAYANAITAGHNNHIGPYEDARDHIDNEWWDHWETITGETGQRGEYFSCSC